MTETISFSVPDKEIKDYLEREEFKKSRSKWICEAIRDKINSEKSDIDVDIDNFFKLLSTQEEHDKRIEEYRKRFQIKHSMSIEDAIKAREERLKAEELQRVTEAKALQAGRDRFLAACMESYREREIPQFKMWMQGRDTELAKYDLTLQEVIDYCEGGK